MEDIIAEYYSLKASRYDSTQRPRERRCDFNILAGTVSKVFQNRNVLEIACGTGYWTQLIAETARSILATDCNPEMIEVAIQKNYKHCDVSFQVSDAFSLQNTAGSFTGGFSGFWWSHIPKSRLTEFMTTFHSKLEDQALIVMLDNNYVEGSNAPIVREDANGNTYQIRKAENGLEYEVLKNFPSVKELKEYLSCCSTKFKIVNLRYYWLVEYSLTKPPPSVHHPLTKGRTR